MEFIEKHIFEVTHTYESYDGWGSLLFPLRSCGPRALCPTFHPMRLSLGPNMKMHVLYDMCRTVGHVFERLFRMSIIKKERARPARHWFTDALAAKHSCVPTPEKRARKRALSASVIVDSCPETHH